MEINKVSLNNCHEINGMVVVIDVIRAFTTAAFAFSVGVEKIYLVSKIEEAFDLQKKIPNSLLIGEIQGESVKGFHFRNSPSQISNMFLEGKQLIMRTSAGTQGVVKSGKADILLTCSFVNAQATLNYIKRLKPNKLTFVMTNQNNGDEDLALADYLEKCLVQKSCVSITPFLERVKNSKLAQLFKNNKSKLFPKADLEAVLKANCFSFIMKVFCKENNFIMISESVEETING